MSAQAQPSADTREPDTDHDPHGIVPEDFCEVWGADSIPEALAAAEQAPSTTPVTEMDLCPCCGSRKIREKPSAYDIAQKKDYVYVCTHCRAHFDTAIAQTTWEEWG